MPDPIPLVRRGKVLDDHWTTGDANIGPHASERVDGAFRPEHAQNGEHLLPAAEAAGFMRWDDEQGAWVWVWQEGFAKDPIRLGTGLFEFALNNQARSADHIAAYFAPDDEGLFYALQQGGSATTARIQIYDANLNPVDWDGLVVVWMERLNP